MGMHEALGLIPTRGTILFSDNKDVQKNKQLFSIIENILRTIKNIRQCRSWIWLYRFDSVSGIALVRDGTLWESAMGLAFNIDGSSGCPFKNHLDGVIYD